MCVCVFLCRYIIITAEFRTNCGNTAVKRSDIRKRSMLKDVDIKAETKIKCWTTKC